MRRLLISLVGLYVLAAVLTTAAEQSGMWKRCGCEPECWCKKPGLSLFRWVVPQARHHRSSPDDKRAVAEAHAN
jgi:hypothetical protein